MPQPTDESDESVLPQRELNPLLNPLLAEHMGRWAEVYFTNPPEKRDQAIAELLRELENSPGPEISPEPSVFERLSDDQLMHEEREEEEEEDQAQTSERELVLDEAAPILTCSSCGEKNWRGQRFCGMCGTPLRAVAERAEEVADRMPVAQTSWSEAGLSPRDNSSEYANEPVVVPARGNEIEKNNDEEEEGVDSTWLRPAGLPAFEPEAEPEPLPHRYRAYIGIVLAIFLAALIYVGWRHTGGVPGASSPQAAPAPAMPTAQPAEAPSTQPGARKNAPMASAPAAVQTQQPSVKSQWRDTPGSRKARQFVSPPSSAPPTATEQSGTKELAQAEKYLKGSRDTSRNSGEAAQWLWKAVGKKNLAAMVELSNLYLRGDGVPKSCDQARLLLDAAARKGQPAAAERLRNLPTFGCQ